MAAASTRERLDEVIDIVGLLVIELGLTVKTTARKCKRALSEKAKRIVI